MPWFFRQLLRNLQCIGISMHKYSTDSEKMKIFSEDMSIGKEFIVEVRGFVVISEYHSNNSSTSPLKAKGKAYTWHVTNLLSFRFYRIFKSLVCSQHFRRYGGMMFECSF